MGLFDTIKNCKIIKEGTTAEDEIIELKSILETCPDSEKIAIEQAIKNLEYGMKGEKAILYELKNSGIPMLVLQDLYLEYEDLSGQIDFLIITRNKNYIIESKNMYGDVSVTDSGDFYRKINGQTKKIYSPITQCERHKNLILQIRYNEKNNIITRALFEKHGPNTYRTLVVMANPTGKISTRYAPKDVKDKVISIDQLVRLLKKDQNPKEETTEKVMMELGNFFLGIHKENPQNYMEKYRNIKQENLEEKLDVAPDTLLKCTRCGSDMVLRVAKKGENAGREFYGCSSFPKCRNIVNISK